MNITDHLPADFAPDSRVWIYQSSRIFFIKEALEIEPMLDAFITKWNSHGTPVKGFANLFYGRFIVLMADENATGVSGCSTDSSVRLIKEIENKFDVSMFDRQTLTFMIKDKIEQLPLSQINYAIENNFINSETLMFDNTVLTRHALEEKWLTPLKNTWMPSRFPALRG